MICIEAERLCRAAGLSNLIGEWAYVSAAVLAIIEKREAQ